MSAGWPERTPSEPPNNFTPAVNKFGIVDRLRLLAPLHRRAALRWAAEAAGLPRDFVPPSLDDLAMAEAPPAISWRTEIRGESVPPATPDDIARGASALMQDIGWRTAQPMQPACDLRAAARRDAEDRLAAARASARVPHIVDIPVSESVTAHQRGVALARQHGPLLIAMADVLDGLDDLIPQSRLAAMPDDEMCALAAARADDEWQRQMARIDIAHATGRTPTQRTPDDKRRACRVWWRRRLRRQAGLIRQHLATALSTVGRGAAPYADDYSLARWQERQESAAKWAAERAIRHADGTTTPMAEVIRGGQQGALHRLGAVLSGMDEIAERDGMTPIMITLTLPPEYHPNPALGERPPGPPISPEATDAAARRLWARFRARCAKSEIRLLGLRVWEPHKDTCPHIHALLYVQPDEVNEVDRHLRELCPEPPRWRGRVASNLVRIDRERSRGSTYVAKYIQKALSAGAGDTEVGRGDDDQLAHYERHRATASERGWRRYALLGTHGVQRAWQRLVTASEPEMEGAPERPLAAWHALEDGQWADALDAMGAIRRPGADEHRIRLTYEIRTTVYGDTAHRAVAVTDTESDWCLPLKRGVNEIIRIGKPSDNNEVTVTVSCPRPGADAPADGDVNLVYDGRGTVYDLATGEILDEIPPCRPPAPLPDWIPNPDCDHVDTD